MTTNGELKSLIDRIETIDVEIDERKEDRKEILKEAKSSGFDTKIIGKLIRIRRRKEQALKEEAELLERYANEIGMQGVLPL